MYIHIRAIKSSRENFLDSLAGLENYIDYINVCVYISIAQQYPEDRYEKA